MPEPAAQPSTAPVIAVAAGELLFREGERHGSLFVIESGQVELLRAHESGSARLALLGPGDVMGEDCAFARRAAGCSARAVVDTVVVRVEAGAFQDVLRVRPDVGTHAIAAIGRRLLEARMACVTAAAGHSQPPAVAAAAAAPAPVPSNPVAGPVRLVHETGVIFPLPAAGNAVLGRSDPRTRFTPDIDLSPVDTERSLSRRHALISRQGERFVLTEEGRVANGTFVNGQRVKPGAATPIEDGDEVCFGLVRTVFRTT